ncbi:TonB-dependent receptor, partial [Candidatus Marinimicrobia bacterium]|nr:TonB-dependent receptor [Candidatus Neomarinimicrobiota bacterium]
MNLTQLLLLYTVLISFVNSQVVGVIKNKVDNKPIEGVNILVGQKGTTSDKDGIFKIEYNVDQDIEFSHIGFKKLSLGKDIFLKNTGVYLIPSIIETEEIFVTSGLNKKNLYKSAKSVTIFTKDRIRENPDIHLQTYLEEVPNLNWAGGSSRPRYFQIRGVGESSHYFGEGPPNFSVGFSVDDMDLSGLGMLGHLFDIGQVEIFKGPQSTTFGSNALAGLIAIKSNDPIRNLGLETSLSFGSDDLRSVGSMLNINLTNNLFLRLSSSVNYSDGFRKNKSLDMSNSNKKEESFARLKVKFFPSPNISFLGTFLYANLSNGYDVWAPDNNMNFNTYSDSLGEDSQLTKGLSIRSEFCLTDNVTITAISSITETDLIHAYDGDWGDSLYWGENHNWDEIIQGWAYSFFDKNKKNRKNLNNEIRFKYSNLTLGLFSKNLEEYDTALGYLYGGSATNANSNFSHDVYAIYGQFEHKITERLSITSNFRGENSKYAYLGQSVGIDSYYEAINLPNISFKTDEEMNGYKFSSKYEMNNKTNFFATFSKGFKAGGVNQQPFLALINRPFGPEFLYNYEIGLKNKTS